jgi:SAM-dependent methyltransferase
VLACQQWQARPQFNRHSFASVNRQETLTNGHTENLSPSESYRLVVTDNPDIEPNLDRFSGFADLYDANRPSPPLALGPLLATYCGTARPTVVDLGSGTGLSTRWAADWAGSVVGVEPNHSMRLQAIERGGLGATYVDGHSTQTGCADSSIDIVLAVQAMHWMEPTATLAEVNRILKPGGVFATIDADWPPVTGVGEAELAWARLHKRIRIFEARISDGLDGMELRKAMSADDPALKDESLSDTHRNRRLPGGVKSWSKDHHLANMIASGLFSFTRELLFDQPTVGSADKFVALIRSQGSYQDLRKRGLTDFEIGMDDFEAVVQRAWVEAGASTAMSFSWRVRLGIKPR